MPMLQPQRPGEPQPEIPPYLPQPRTSDKTLIHQELVSHNCHKTYAFLLFFSFLGSKKCS
jgi:hypothetical protein